jgi:hypothetical protein
MKKRIFLVKGSNYSKSLFSQVCLYCLPLITNYHYLIIAIANVKSIVNLNLSLSFRNKDKFIQIYFSVNALAAITLLKHFQLNLLMEQTSTKP